VTGAQIQYINQALHKATETQGPVVFCADADEALDMMRLALALAAPLRSGRDLTPGQRAASKLCIQSALTFMHAQLKKQGDANQDIGTGM
jgi:SpoU rRNA methylase family enzyme